MKMPNIMPDITQDTAQFTKIECSFGAYGSKNIFSKNVVSLNCNNLGEKAKEMQSIKKCNFRIHISYSTTKVIIAKLLIPWYSTTLLGNNS